MFLTHRPQAITLKRSEGIPPGAAPRIGPELRVAQVQRSAIAQGFAHFAPELALFGGGGFDFSPDALASDYDSLLERD